MESIWPVSYTHLDVYKRQVLTYGQYHAAMIANYQCVPIRESDRVMDFLPITHIFERGWLYLCLTVGAHIIINTYPKEIQESMREMHPTLSLIHI